MLMNKTIVRQGINRLSSGLRIDETRRIEKERFMVLSVVGRKAQWL